MSRVALLMGVSRYGGGLDPLPDAQKDVEMMKRVLKQPRFRFDSVECLCDRPLPAMQEAVERFFGQRHSDDQLIVLFCGYLLHDAEGKLYFATSSTQREDEGAIDKAQTMPASTLQKAMNQSPARQQVFVLNYYSQPLLAKPSGESPGKEQPSEEQPSEEQPNGEQRTEAARVYDLEAHLGGAGRVLLAASNTSRQAPIPHALDVWTYPRYLAEGLESGAADTDDDGRLTAAHLHRYAAQKLQVAAPALKTEMYGSAAARMPLLEVPHDDPRVHYRKVLEAASIAIDASGAPTLEGLLLLKDLRQSLGVSPQEAAVLEAQVLRPTWEYHQRTALYQEQVAECARSHDVTSLAARQTLKHLQQALYLSDQDVAMMTIAPSLVGRQHQQISYQRNLAQYQQVLLWAMQRQYPLREGDRRMLHRLQQTLHLGDDDVRTIETQITTQAEQFTAVDFTAADFTSVDSDDKAAVKGTDISETNADSQTSQAFPATEVSGAPSVSPLPLETATAPTEDSRTKEAIVQRLFSLNEPITPALEPTPKPEPELQPVSVPEPLPMPPNPKSNPMDRVRRSASNYQALLIPALLLAAIIGLLAAILPSAGRPNWLKFGQTPADPVAAQRLNLEGRRKAQDGYNKAAIDTYNQAIAKNPNDVTTYTNRGVSYHRLGNTGAAIKDYEQALKLAPKSAQLHSNLSYAYYDRQNYDKALEEGNQAVALNGNLAEAHINLANARSKKGDYDGALRDYGQALTLTSSAPVLAGVYNNRGNLLLARNGATAALGDYNQAIRLKPDYADAYYNLGLAQASGNPSAAVRNLQTAAALYKNQGKDALQKEALDRAATMQHGKV